MYSTYFLPFSIINSTSSFFPLNHFLFSVHHFKKLKNYFWKKIRNKRNSKNFLDLLKHRDRKLRLFKIPSIREDTPTLY